MKIKEGFVKREVMGKRIIVPTGVAGKSIDGVIRLNATASAVWDWLEEGIDTPEALAEKLSAEYGVSKAEAAQDVEELIASFEKVGIFE